jgi:uridylate kinase
MVKLSGSFLTFGKESESLSYLDALGEFVSGLIIKHDVALTVGGGELARQYIGLARALQQPDSQASLLGGDVGLMNCRLLIAALQKWNVYTYSTPIEDWGLARQFLQQGGTPVLCGHWPALTSDAVAAYFADYASMDILIKLSSVDAIYDRDPKLNNDALPRRRLTHCELEAMTLAMDRRESGSRAVLDIVAARRLKNSDIPLLLLHRDQYSTVSEMLNRRTAGDVEQGSLVGEMEKVVRIGK